MEMNRCVFLDIDGVLNSSRTAVAYQQLLQRELDPVSVRMLYRIVVTCEAAIVVSSTWRLGNDWRELVWGCLRGAGWPVDYYKWMINYNSRCDNPIIDRTGKGGPTRGHEIQEWLDNHPEVDDYLILDDDNDMLESQQDRMIHCDHRVGLSFDDWMRIREIWPEVDNQNYGSWVQEQDEPREFEYE